MADMIKLSQAVIVEGKYDKIKLSQIIDAFIIETNGFSIFKDKKRLDFIKQLANERGIIILTDSDHAGFMIRNYIKSSIPNDKIINVYIPDILGKEKRKDAPSKEGKLGVEGMTKEILLDAFNKANVKYSSSTNDNPVKVCDLFELGLSGTNNAKQNKKKLLSAMNLPEFLSTNSLLTCINSQMSKEDFYELCAQVLNND
jgi:ribonuclease M5